MPFKISKLFVTDLIIIYYVFMGKKYFSGLIRNIFRFFNIFRIFVLNIVFWGIIAVMAAAALKGSIVPSIEKEDCPCAASERAHCGAIQRELFQ